tara:strand:+ start:1862 stop:2824 length:963 start_codon:yes stop_codon:yes gene_type:complete
MVKKNVLLIVALVAIGAIMLGVIDNPFATKAAAPTKAAVTTTEVVCESSTTPDLDINTIDIENIGTSLTEATNSIRKVGDTTWTTFTAGTANTNLQVGAKYEVLLGATSANQIDNAYGEYLVVGPIACRETTTLDKKVYNDEVEGSVTATFYNEDANAAAQAIGAGGIKWVEAKFEAGNDEVYGNPFIATSGLGDNGKHRAKYPNMFCIDHLESTWDRPLKVMFGAVEMNQLSVPIRHNPGSGNNTYCYEAPIIDENGQRLKLHLDADDSTNPTLDESSFLYAAGFYINNDTSKVEWGVEDQDGDPVATSDPVSLALDFS